MASDADNADSTATTLGSFACRSGTLVVCDTAPSTDFADPRASRDGSRCLHVAVQPGRFRVEYVHSEDGPDSIPAEVHVLHESLPCLPKAMTREMRLQIEGGRIAVVDRARIAEAEVCEDFLYEAADSIQHDCGLVITTWGDGEYRVLTDGGDSAARALRIVLEEEEAS
jgi:hypothetical protein